MLSAVIVIVFGLTCAMDAWAVKVAADGGAANAANMYIRNTDPIVNLTLAQKKCIRSSRYAARRWHAARRCLGSLRIGRGFSVNDPEYQEDREEVRCDLREVLTAEQLAICTTIGVYTIIEKA